MEKIKNMLGRAKTEVTVNLGRMRAGDFSMFDKGDRKAFLAGNVIGTILLPTVVMADGLETELSTAFNTVWDYGLKIAWALAAVMALVAIIWTIAAGSKEVSKPLTWLRRIVLAVIGINFILTVIKWAKDINTSTTKPGSLITDAPAGTEG